MPQKLTKDFAIISLLSSIGFLCFYYVGYMLNKVFLSFFELIILLIVIIGLVLVCMASGVYTLLQKFLGRLPKYLIAGFANTGIDFAFLNFLIYTSGTRTSIVVALFNLASFSLATLHSYFWMRYWVFESREKASAGQFLNFWTITSLGAIVSSVVVYSGVSLLSIGERVATIGGINIVKVIAAVIWIAMNFFGYKKFIFKHVQVNT